ncbi:LPS export ABC transporter permease LptG [Pantoea sp. Aalb]|uniref:LPS export ABC transporter permease LptG n=1 Tax=Pantoea sp. Aalb TaxID=2576762 RepID=UPI001328A0F8|nr:LPS export ABC transporter permease LptG [Pantoea sp. Aalb]MXP67848.1 LPS export ABC transporter permease LptG [Pantoea sp. Aalb]
MTFRILDKYIGKKILNTIIIILFIIISLSSIIKFTAELRKVGQGNYVVRDCIYYSLLTIFKDIETFFPMAVLLGTLVGLGILAQHNELMVMQTCGFTSFQVTVAVMKIAIPLVIFIIIIGEFIAPKSEQIAYNYRSQKLYGGTLISTNNGVWAKDGNKFIYFKQNKSNGEVEGIKLYSFNNEFNLINMFYTNKVYWDFKKKKWIFFNANELNFEDLTQITHSKKTKIEWKTIFTPDKINIVMLHPDILSIIQLYNYSVYLKQSGQYSKNHILNVWNKIFHPLSVIVMMLMGIVFIFSSLNRISVGVYIVTGISFGFLFYILDHIFRTLNLVSNFPPILCATLPTALFLTITIFMLIKNN